MSSTIVLTEKIRDIPYFSFLHSDEKEVIVPRDKVNESLDYKNVEDISTEDLVIFISNRIYLGFEQKDNDELVKELFWRLGETEETMKYIEIMDVVVRNELKMRLTEYGAKYIYGIRCRIKKPPVFLCEKAAWYNNLKLLKWYRSQDYQWGNTVSFASAQGNIEIIKWAYVNNCPMDCYSCDTASFHGRLETLKYLRKIGCQWSCLTIIWAVQHGHFELLKWAMENNCPLEKTHSLCNYAITSRNIKILDYVHNKWPEWPEYAYTIAEQRSEYDYDSDGEYTDEKKNRVLKYLEDNGCPKE